ncbi:MAG: hypothetical protein RMM17_05715 [Acidobacteriota bacterium]|nr:hypothetical protein [Blastocatellia bacterium]MDW8412163.1 hypothetical protein [Acidobacteriota bacterium]
MAMTMRQELSFRIRNLDDTQVAEALRLISSIQSANESKEDIIEDTLIASLENAWENRKARQVYEWDKVRRRAEQEYYRLYK